MGQVIFLEIYAAFPNRSIPCDEIPAMREFYREIIKYHRHSHR